MKVSKDIDGSNYKASTKLQIVLLITFTIFLAWSFYKTIGVFYSVDEYPPIVSMTPQRVVKLGGSPATVDVGIFIRGLPEFDITKGKVSADLIVWFLFDPRLLSLDTISKFAFDNADTLYKSAPYTRVEGKKIIVRYDMKVLLRTSLNYKHFPLDDHRIDFMLTNYFLSPSEVVFKASRANMILSPEVRTTGWVSVDKFVRTGYLSDSLDPYNEDNSVLHPRTIFSFDFARTGFRHIMLIVIPLLLIFIITLFSLSFNPYGPFTTAIMPISAGGITAIIAHHFVVDRMSPVTGYLMISNYLFLFTLTGCTFVFLINVFARRIKRPVKNTVILLLYGSLMSMLSWLMWLIF